MVRDGRQLVCRKCKAWIDAGVYASRFAARLYAAVTG